jgi:hypothetical protein
LRFTYGFLVNADAPIPLVRVRIRTPTSGVFVLWKNATMGFELAIHDNTITIEACTLPRWLRRILGLTHSLTVSDTSMRRETVGWLDTSLFAEASIVLSYEQPNGRVELAVVPADHDLDRLALTLSEAGVTLEPPTEPISYLV